MNSPNLRPPGVYFQRSDAPPAAIEATRTDMAAFVGIAERGPLHEAVRVDSWHQFQSRFGNDYLPYAYMPDAVRGFFANGGQTAWIVRVGRVDAPPHPGLRPFVNLVNDRGQTVLCARAKHLGLAGSKLALRITPLRGELFHLTVLVDGQELEYFRNLSSQRPDGAGASSRWAVDIISPRFKYAYAEESSSGSQLIELVEPARVDMPKNESRRVVGLSIASVANNKQQAQRPVMQAAWFGTQKQPQHPSDPSCMV